MTDIEALLKQHFNQQEYIDDNGFTANVMLALPHHKKINPLLKFSIYCLPVLLVSIWVIGQLPVRDIIHEVAAFWLLIDAQEFLMLAGAAFASFITYIGFTFMADEEV
jgi:hypothetical protein